MIIHEEFGIIDLINQGQYDLALESIAKNDLTQYDKLMLKSLIYLEMGYKRQAKDFAEEALNLDETSKSPNKTTFSHIIRSLAMIIGGPFDHVNEVLEQAEISFSKIKRGDDDEKRYLEAMLLTARGAIAFYVGDRKHGEETLEKAISIFEELELDEELARTHHYLARIYSPKDAIPILEEALDIWDANNNQARYASTSCFIGSRYILLGDFNKAKSYNQTALDISIEIDQKYSIATARECLGNISLGRGEPKDAVEHFDHSVEIWKELENPWFRTSSLLSLGRAYFHLGEMDLSLQKLIECFHIREEIGLQGGWLIEPLFHMIRTCIELDLVGDVEMYNARLQELKLLETTPNTEAFGQLAEAIILQNSNRLRKKMESQQVLEEIDLNDPQVKWTIKILAMKYMCQALLIEVEYDNSPALFREIGFLIERILFIAQEQHMNSIEVETMVFKSKLELINGNITSAQKLLSTAAKTAEEYQLSQMIQLVERERGVLSSDYNLWTEADEKGISIKQKMQRAEIVEYLELALDLKDRSNEFG